MGTSSAKLARVVKLQDVADRAGVSCGTASRALSGARKVSPHIVERVKLAARQLGYRPNQAARNLRLSRTMTLGAVFSVLVPLHVDFLEGLGRESQEHGYTLLTSTACGDPELYRTLVQNLFDRRVDALLAVLPPDLDSALDPYKAGGVPAITVFGHTSNARYAPLVMGDEHDAIRQATRRLAELQHRAVLYLCSPSGATSSRVPMLHDAARACGLTLYVDPSGSSGAPEEIATMLERWLCRPPGVTALFVDQLLAPAIAAACTLLRRHFPVDASLVVFGESSWTRGLALPWSTIRIDLQAAGRAAIRLVLDWIAGVVPTDVTNIAVAEWVERESVGPAPLPRSVEVDRGG